MDIEGSFEKVRKKGRGVKSLVVQSWLIAAESLPNLFLIITHAELLYLDYPAEWLGVGGAPDFVWYIFLSSLSISSH